MRMLSQYKVINNSGEVIARGTAEECAKTLGIQHGSFLRYANFPEKVCNSNYVIIKTYEPEGKVGNSPEIALAVRRWDEFVTPIRKKYGIPVWKPEKGGAG